MHKYDENVNEYLKTVLKTLPHLQQGKPPDFRAADHFPMPVVEEIRHGQSELGVFKKRVVQVQIEKQIGIDCADMNTGIERKTVDIAAANVALAAG